MSEIITYNDFIKVYSTTIWEPPVEVNLKDNKTYTIIPIPESGHLLTIIMSILKYI